MRAIDLRGKCATKRRGVQCVEQRVDLANSDLANSDLAHPGSIRRDESDCNRKDGDTPLPFTAGSSAALSVAVSPITLDRLLECVPAVPTVRFGRGKHVAIAGDTIRCFYVNHNGWLFRYKILHNGNRQIVDFVLPGEVFALQACLFKTSLYSIVTVTPASLSPVPRDMIDGIFGQNSRFSRAIFWCVVREAARNIEHLTNAARRSAYERLGHLLLELFVRLRMAGLTEGSSFYMPLTQELLADALGLTTIHVSRTLRILREDNFLRIENKRVTILNLETLSSLCDFESSYLDEYNCALRQSV